MTNLGGHCVETLTEIFAEQALHDRPVAFVAYTIKGWNTPLAGHKDNHAGLDDPHPDGRLPQGHGRAGGA